MENTYHKDGQKASNTWCHVWFHSYKKFESDVLLFTFNSRASSAELCMLSSAELTHQSAATGLVPRVRMAMAFAPAPAGPPTRRLPARARFSLPPRIALRSPTAAAAWDCIAMPAPASIGRGTLCYTAQKQPETLGEQSTRQREARAGERSSGCPWMRCERRRSLKKPDRADRFQDGGRGRNLSYVDLGRQFGCTPT